jgi:predicted amidohydrolase
MSRHLTIGLAHIQLESDINLQYKKICDYVDKAKTQGIDIICFPEMSLGHGLSDDDKERILNYQKDIAELSYGVQIV